MWRSILAVILLFSLTAAQAEIPSTPQSADSRWTPASWNASKKYSCRMIIVVIQCLHFTSRANEGDGDLSPTTRATCTREQIQLKLTGLEKRR